MSPIDLITIKARALGFRFQILGGDKYQVVLNGTSKGYRGTLKNVEAYLQGWEEAKVYALTKESL